MRLLVRLPHSPIDPDWLPESGSTGEEMKIGIIGAGNIGSALAGHFRKLRHTVLIANSRGPWTLSRVARETGATPVAIRGVANGVDLLVITIPMKSMPSLPEDLLFRLPAASPIIDTGNYYPLRDGVITEIDGGMTESEWTSHVLGRPVVKAFNNIVADSLLHKGLPKGSKNRIALPVSGDDVRSRQLVMALIDEMGFDAFDAGALSESWRYQPGTPAYCSDPTIEQLPALLERAKRDKAQKNRDQAAKLMAKLPPDFPPQELVRVARLSAGLDSLNPRSWIALLHLGFAALRPQRLKSRAPLVTRESA
jgi:8-hydroxy-5-deazaflavin:NADPH oxidoreductase